VVHGLYGTPLDLLPEPEKRQLVQEACVQAFADEFIRRLPDGYDTLVGDRGSLLSGGQRQRVAIARTVISNPRILLLDEATSALDPTAERKVQAALNNVTKSRTTIVIAHKLSTIQSADKIVVLNQGTFVEQGTHQELLAQQGVYYKLTNAQVLGPSQEVSKQAVSERFDIVKPVGSIEKAEPYIPTSPGDDSASFLSGEIKSNASDSDEDPDNNITRRYSLVHCLAVMIFKDQRLIWTLFLAGTIASLAGGGLFPAQAVLFGESIPTLQIPPSEHLVRRGNFWALMYFVLALGVLLAYLGVGFFWTIAAFHATRFYRREYFDSMLRQDVCYFDIKGHSPAEMTSRLSTNPQRLQNLLSTNLALILVVIVNLTSCCILALVVGWQLGLVVIASGIPVLFGSGFFRMRLEMTNQDRVSRMYLESARFVSEAIGSIRTVSSLTLENKILNGYSTLLAVSSRAEMKTKMLSMLMFAFSESASLGVSGLAFWYGGKLMYEGKYNVTEFFIVFIAVVYGAHAAGYLFGFTSGKRTRMEQLRKPTNSKLQI
jgi:ATP-binding cassette subfamily B (MDR/TAP) protein 1